MFGQVGGLGKALGADGAHIRTHPCVDLAVLLQSAGQRECFAAVRTGERSLPEVLALVALQGEWFIEGLATVGAGEGLVVCMHVTLVLPQVRGADEVLATAVADIGLFPCVGSDVLAIV